MLHLLVLLLAMSFTCGLPMVDPGLFVILGVRTCGAGGGYCLLGSDCTLDRDFEPDTAGGHCDGLRFAFTPAAHFVCCRYVERSNATLPGEPGDEFTTTEDPGRDREASTPSTTTPSAANQQENVVETDETAMSKGDSNSIISTETKTAMTASEEMRPATASESNVLVGAYPVRGPDSQTDEPDRVLVTASCLNSSNGEVNPCWRTSFVDRTGTVLCSGSMVGVESAVTTAVCANRLLNAGVAGVTMRVAESWLHVRDVAVHEEYHPPVEGGAPSSQNDIAVVRLLSAPAAAADPRPCIACLSAPTAAAGGTCFALAARFNGLGEESSAVCAGSVVSMLGGLLKLRGCEVASLKSGVMKVQGQVSAGPAVLAREGAALLCQGGLVGLASTSVGSYLSLAQHKAWLSRTLSATRTVTDHFFRA